MTTPDQPTIEVVPDGPLRVTGAPLVRMRPVIDDEGVKVDWERGEELPHDDSYELCRCGVSGNKPFCDGREKAAEFDGTETAGRGSYAEGAWTFGEGAVVMTDNPS